MSVLFPDDGKRPKGKRGALRAVPRPDGDRRNDDQDKRPGDVRDLLPVLSDARGSYMLTTAGPVSVASNASKSSNAASDALGITVAPLPLEVLRQRRAEAQGLVVLTVTPQSRAARAGLRPGDVIERVNRLPLLDVEMLRRAVRAMHLQPMLLQVTRKETRFYITASGW